MPLHPRPLVPARDMFGLSLDRGHLMGKLAGFNYRQIVRGSKIWAWSSTVSAAGSHQIWFNPAINRYTTIPNHPGACLGERYAPY